MSDDSAALIIPMDGPIEEFRAHLESHPRTILSARFGDGKSFFLKAAEEKLSDSHVFVKLYPVNYQVVDNKDIFEYIKRDLLVQLYGLGLVPDTYEIPDSIASYYFLCNNWEAFAEEFLEDISYLDASNTIKATMGAAKFLRSMGKKYGDYKKNGGDLGERLDRFIKEFEDRGIYEADLITRFICDIIQAWREQNPKKKICLVFEDMDRIDPAHVFRILNVISAQMDYGYKYGESPQSSSLAGNKFGVDNIVICLDYNNLKKIFQHFYGANVSFEGYINKFTDKGYFNYSLRELTQQYYQNELLRVTGLDNNAIKCILDRFDITEYTLRQFFHAISDVDRQVSLPEANSDIVPHKGLFIIAAILRRLGLSTNEIITRLSDAFRRNPGIIGPYVATSMMLRQNKGQSDFKFIFNYDTSGYTARYTVASIQPNGQSSIEKRLFTGPNPQETVCDPVEEMRYILRHVGK